MQEEEILETDQNENESDRYNWFDKGENCVKNSYSTQLRDRWTEGYIQDKNENTRYYCEAIYDNYMKYLETEGFVDEGGMIIEINENGNRVMTLEEFARNNYHIDEINQQNEWELGKSKILSLEPPIETEE